MSKHPLSEAIRTRLINYGATVIQNEHFVYNSGLHADTYVCVDSILSRPSKLRHVTSQLVSRWVPENNFSSAPVVEVVASPAVGGICFGLASSFMLEQLHYAANQRAGKYLLPQNVVHVFADKTPGGRLAFQRIGFASACKGKNVLVVEDIVSSGKTTKALIACVREAGGTVIGAVSFLNNSELGASDLGVPRFDCLVNVTIPQYDAVTCPSCRAHKPIIIDDSFGRGHVYALVENPDYIGGFKQLNL